MMVSMSSSSSCIPIQIVDGDDTHAIYHIRHAFAHGGGRRIPAKMGYASCAAMTSLCVWRHPCPFALLAKYLMRDMDVLHILNS
jgi:hypothetical protein